MNNKKMLLATTVVLALAAAWCVAQIPAQFTAQRKATLDGLQTVAVKVLPLKAELEKDGVTAAALQQRTEKLLTAAGIPLTTSDDAPALYVRITSKRLLDRTYMASVCVELRELVHPARDKDMTILASTWNSSTIATLPLDKISQLNDIAADQVNEFIKAYQAANAKAAK